MVVETIKNAKCLAHAARDWLPTGRNGNAMHPSVLTRWGDRGILVNGKRVFLETWRVGGQRVTTQAAVETFLSLLNENTPSEERRVADDSARRAKQAGKALEAIGA